VHCYLLCVCRGSSVDRFSNNASLFALVEQINLPDSYLTRPAGRVLPLEIHAYFTVSNQWIDRDFELRFVLVADTGLETVGEVQRYSSKFDRFRLRSFGLPQPPVFGAYHLHVEVRAVGMDRWLRQGLEWPLRWAPVTETPRLTH
jgi:hypothetical protein